MITGPGRGRTGPRAEPETRPVAHRYAPCCGTEARCPPLESSTRRPSWLGAGARSREEPMPTTTIHDAQELIRRLQRRDLMERINALRWRRFTVLSTNESDYFERLNLGDVLRL